MRLTAGTVYRTQFFRTVTTGSLIVKDGTVDIYGSNSNEKPSSTSDMVLDSGDTGVRGNLSFASMPKWIAYVDNTADGEDPIIVEDNNNVIDLNFGG